MLFTNGSLLTAITQVGCLCEHNWVCPSCFVWNRSETSFDGGECVWCGNRRPDDYHPATWKTVGSLGEDTQCPVMLIVRRQKDEAAEDRSRGEQDIRLELLKLDALPAPRTVYPRLTKHPPIVSQRGTADGRRIEEVWQTMQSGCAIIDEGETETDRFEDEDTDIVERTGVPDMVINATDDFDWNPVRRFLNKKGQLEGAVAKTQVEKDADKPASERVITAQDLRRQRVGVVQSMLR